MNFLAGVWLWATRSRVGAWGSQSVVAVCGLVLCVHVVCPVFSVMRGCRVGGPVLARVSKREDVVCGVWCHRYNTTFFVLEFQARGLPHVHLLAWPAVGDGVVCAIGAVGCPVVDPWVVPFSPYLAPRCLSDVDVEVCVVLSVGSFCVSVCLLGVFVWVSVADAVVFVLFRCALRFLLCDISASTLPSVRTVLGWWLCVGPESWVWLACVGLALPSPLVRGARRFP